MAERRESGSLTAADLLSWLNIGGTWHLLVDVHHRGDDMTRLGFETRHDWLGSSEDVVTISETDPNDEEQP